MKYEYEIQLINALHQEMAQLELCGWQQKFAVTIHTYTYMYMYSVDTAAGEDRSGISLRENIHYENDTGRPQLTMVAMFPYGASWSVYLN